MAEPQQREESPVLSAELRRLRAGAARQPKQVLPISVRAPPQRAWAERASQARTELLFLPQLTARFSQVLPSAASPWGVSGGVWMVPFAAGLGATAHPAGH